MGEGNRHRIWYPEIVAYLRNGWKEDGKNEYLIHFAKYLTKKVRAHREKLGVKDPVRRCPDCGEEHAIDASIISIGSLLAAAERYNVCSHEEYERLYRSWLSYQRRHQLTKTGKSK